MPKTKPIAQQETMSLAAFGRRRGVSGEAVRKAIDERRLEHSVVWVGDQPKIGDPELADREWAERTRAAPTIDAPSDLVDVPDSLLPMHEARRRREVEAWQAAKVQREAEQLELAVRRGELVSTAEAAEVYGEVISAARTKVLAAPSRLKQRAPHIAAADIRLLEDILAEALEELAAEPALAEGP